MVFFGRKDIISNSTNVPLNTVYALKGQKIYNRQVYSYLTQINTTGNTVIVPAIGTEAFIKHYTFARLNDAGEWVIIPSLKTSANEVYVGGSAGDLRVNIGTKNGFQPNTRLYIEFVYEVDPVTKFNKKWV